ncbi:MAG: nitrate/sulfonate/bicarbonate ABC transporter ATP-binding protein [Proteobacteria bacterium]|nr:nitrate/sulfonate/bicarbonate ABC transporter ATP-binding protein [Pseudomonadota bacterium]
MENWPLLQVKNVRKSFKKRGAPELLVLDKVNFNIHAGEIVALLGKSGSGKSTLLRIIAGLTQPTGGEALFHNKPILQPEPGLTMVFQNFALLPWLTVLENVELGLEAQGVEQEERRKRALKAIDIVGLDGFESAYPKELSGGMAQRVGFARALVVDPELLLMDEPFSALDVLTAENLRSDLIDIWETAATKIKAVLLVTHNIEEAAFLADRIFVFGTNPGHVAAEIKVDIKRPRDYRDPQIRQLVDDIYTLMTRPEAARITMKTPRVKTIGLTYRLPKAEITEVIGFIEELAYEYQDKADLPNLAEKLHLEIDSLFPLTEALEILRFSIVSEGDISLTEQGKMFAAADILQRKQIFAAHLMSYVPLARHIRQALDRKPDHMIQEDNFLEELQGDLSEAAAEEVLSTVIDWGRYAELFAYDYNTGILSLENPQ